MSGAFGGFVFGGGASGGSPGGGLSFLTLSQRAAVECGIADRSAILSALTTVVGATGSFGRIVGWVNDAWVDIQTECDDWAWMRSSALLGAGVSFETVAGQASYPLGTGPGTVGVDEELFGKWARGTFRSYSTSTGFNGEIDLGDIWFEEWRDVYMFGAMRNQQTQPVVVAVGSDQSLCLGPPPNGLYTVTGDYFVAPSVMVLDTDVPLGMPARFHGLIVSRVMMKCGQYESAPELFQRGSQESAVTTAQLYRARAPRPRWAGALA